MGKPRLLIVDANVLIDYESADLGILRLVTTHLGQVFVPRALLREVPRLTPDDCERLGLQLVDPETEQALEAGASRGALSFEDHLCLIMARDGGWTCVTNDKALRRACADARVAILWGLELMIELVAKGDLTASAALKVAEKIHACNPRHITDEVVKAFKRRLRS